MTIRPAAIVERTTVARPANSWQGLGINYSASNSGDVDRDIPFLANYFSRMRPQFPLYTADSTLQRYICTQAKAHGFYVVWGITTPNPCNASTWGAFLSTVTALVPVAQSLGIDQLSLGNECELHVDGTTLTTATVRSDIRALSTTVKAAFGGTVSYETDQSQTSNWASEGIGSLDLLGVNLYSGYPAHIAHMSTIGPSKTYVSEFNLSSGYFSANNEQVFTNNVMDRVRVLRASGVQTAYFYNWQYDIAYEWALHLPNAAYRQVFGPLTGTRA